MAAHDPRPDPTGASRPEFPFRPWVRRTCVKALVWGLGVVALLGLAGWWLREPGSAPLTRAFWVLAGYGLLFLASLLKVWWTAGGPVVVLDEEDLSYRPLHAFRSRRISFDSVLAAAPRPGMQSLRLVYQPAGGHALEFFLNLGLIGRRHEFLDTLGERLEASGLRPLPGAPPRWARPGWEGEAGGGPTSP